MTLSYSRSTCCSSCIPPSPIAQEVSPSEFSNPFHLLCVALITGSLGLETEQWLLSPYLIFFFYHRICKLIMIQIAICETCLTQTSICLRASFGWKKTYKTDLELHWSVHGRAYSIINHTHSFCLNLNMTHIYIYCEETKKCEEVTEEVRWMDGFNQHVLSPSHQILQLGLWL